MSVFPSIRRLKNWIVFWLSKTEQDVILQAQQIIKKLTLVPCTGCKYCDKACPQNIGIPGSFAAMNLWTIYKDLAFAKNQEFWSVIKQGKSRSSECIECHSCEKVCPQHIAISEELKKVTNLFKD